MQISSTGHVQLLHPAIQSRPTAGHCPQWAISHGAGGGPLHPPCPSHSRDGCSVLFPLCTTAVVPRQRCRAVGAPCPTAAGCWMTPASGRRTAASNAWYESQHLPELPKSTGCHVAEDRAFQLMLHPRSLPLTLFCQDYFGSLYSFKS